MSAKIIALRREVKLKYARQKRLKYGTTKLGIVAIRVRELERLFKDRWGDQLPDDDAGRSDALIMAQHIGALCRDEVDKRADIKAWLSRKAPWMGQDETEGILNLVISKPQKFKADRLGKLLSLQDWQRKKLRICTIGCIEMTSQERRAKRLEASRIRCMVKRRNAGAKIRKYYESESATKTKPWKLAGISRATWYRRQRETDETSPNTP